MREEWVKALISQGEDVDYLEKLSNKEIYRAFMGQQGQLAKKKKAEEEEKPNKKVKSSIYTSIDEVLQLPDSDLRRTMELGEANEPENEGGRHLLLVIKHYFNPSKDEIIDVKPLESHSPFISWSYNAQKDEFTLTDVKGQKMRCSSKAIFKMASKDIKTLSELSLSNPNMDQSGYVVERIVSNMQKLQQQKQ
ncbi:hypothetical protein L1987_15306 [Smallanthus sonchifolius]|uniref:Uncharacterized protein n=1 Tax=Smallanthus sonchifolius TaxID=185202 RepID=A0ACB9J613_9ASTR|nr:hypothetical protein L1987_15306 [Smallanthus sonchifolius]